MKPKQILGLQVHPWGIPGRIETALSLVFTTSDFQNPPQEEPPLILSREDALRLAVMLQEVLDPAARTPSEGAAH